ncbi:MAG: hypothetical protein EZS28_048257, partial [Streblomastix strix]
SVPTVDEQGYQSYPAEPPPQYRQAIYQQQAYQQNIIPNQNQISTVSQVPIYKTYHSNTILYSEARNEQLDPFSDAQSRPIPHNALVPSKEDTKVDGETFTMNNSNFSTILFDPLVNKGIVKFDVQSIRRLDAVGIADETVKYERNEYPGARALLGQEKIVQYDWNGKIAHIGDFIEGNAEFFKTGDCVALEVFKHGFKPANVDILCQ